MTRNIYKIIGGRLSPYRWRFISFAILSWAIPLLFSKYYMHEGSFLADYVRENIDNFMFIVAMFGMSFWIFSLLFFVSHFGSENHWLEKLFIFKFFSRANETIMVVIINLILIVGTIGFSKVFYYYFFKT